MRHFTKFVAGIISNLLCVIAIGIVSACTVSPSLMFEDEPKPEDTKGTITGLVMLSNGNPAAKVIVKVRVPRAPGAGPANAPDQIVAAAQTDSNGRYSIEAPPGIYKIVAKKLGYKGEAEVEVIAGKKVEIDIMMEKIGNHEGN